MTFQLNKAKEIAMWGDVAYFSSVVFPFILGRDKEACVWGRIKLLLRSTRLTKSSPITSFEEDSSTLSITVSLSSLNILHYHCFSPAPPLQQKISWSLLLLLVMVIYRNTSLQRQTQQHYAFFAIILPIKLDPFSGNYIFSRRYFSANWER